MNFLKEIGHPKHSDSIVTYWNDGIPIDLDNYIDYKTIKSNHAGLIKLSHNKYLIHDPSFNLEYFYNYRIPNNLDFVQQLLFQY